MRIALATLCDYATVREGLLTVVSAGITRMWRAQLPGTLNACVAVLLELGPAEQREIQDFDVTITGPDGVQLATGGGGVQSSAPIEPLEPDESTYVPLALDFRPVPVTKYGWHTIRLRIAAHPPLELRFKVGSRSPAAAPPVVPAKISGPH